MSSHAKAVQRHRQRVAKHNAVARRRKIRGHHIKLVGLTNMLKRAKISAGVKSVRRKLK